MSQLICIWRGLAGMKNMYNIGQLSVFYLPGIRVEDVSMNSHFYFNT